MTTVHIEHSINDFATWKAVFDSFGDMRAEHNVRRYEVSRPVDDPRFVMIRLEFDSTTEAEAFLTTMRGNWERPKAATVLGSTPQTRIAETVEAREL